MSKPNYTRRRSGRDMVDIRLTFQVERGDVEALARAAGVSENAALSLYREAYTREASNGIAYHAFGRCPVTGRVDFFHIDDFHGADGAERLE